jgi:RHS repeat-associated protein
MRVREINLRFACTATRGLREYAGGGQLFYSQTSDLANTCYKLKVQVAGELVALRKWNGTQWVLVQSAEFNGPVSQGNVGFCVFDSIGQFDDFQANYNGYTWTTANRFTLGPGAVGGIISERSASTNKWYHYDAIGNVMELTNQSGLQYLSYEQEAFGNVLSGTSSGYHLTTKEYDADAGLYYFWARWYDPLIGRFTQRDPRGARDYTYCFDSPVDNTDATGEVTIGSSCTGCDRIMIGEAIAEQAIQIALEVTDPGLRKCILKRLFDNGRIECNGPKACGNPRHAGGYIEPHVPIIGPIIDPIINPIFPSHTIYLCTDNIRNQEDAGVYEVPSIAELIVHEFAHSCGWDEGEDQNVPEP